MGLVKGMLKAFIVFFAVATTAQAQDYWSQCWYNSSNVLQCYSTLDEAIDAYVNRPFTGGAKIKPGESFRGTGQRTLTYYDQITVAPIVFTPPEYSSPGNHRVACPGHASSSEPCSSEDEVFTAIETWYNTNYGASNIQSFSRVGAFLADAPADFSQSVFYALGYGTAIPRELVITLKNGTVFREQLTKVSYYGCPTGYNSNDIGNRAHAGPGADPSRLGTVDDLCGGQRNVVIFSGKSRQTKSKAANCNPCYPVTADKARFETDFEFAGRPFTRVYHSTGMTSLPEMGRNWSHSYGDQLLKQPENTGFSMARDEAGYLEGYTLVASGISTADLTPGRVVTAVADGFVMTDLDGTRREFNAAGFLIKLIDAADSRQDVTIQRDPRHRIASLTDGQGRVARFFYTADTAEGTLQRIELPDGQEITYGHDSDGNLTTVTYPDSSVRTYHYHEEGLAPANLLGLLTGISDENGDRYASFGYDNRARVVSSRLHSDGDLVANTSLAYGNFYDVTVTSDGKPNAVTYVNQFSNYPRPSSVVSAGRTTYNTYTGNYVSERTDPLGNVTKYGYTDNRLTSTTEAFGTLAERQTTYTYTATGRPETRTLSGLVGGTMTPIVEDSWTYNARQQVLTHAKRDLATSQSRQVAYVYCEQADVDADLCPTVGLLIGIDGPRADVSDVTVFTYYGEDDAGCTSGGGACAYRKGDVWKVLNALNQATEYLAYDPTGRILRVKDANNVVTDLEYHVRGWLTASKVRGANDASETDDAITRFSYDDVGQVTRVTLPDGSYTQYIYDTAHRLTKVSDSAGNSISYELDAGGNATAETSKDPGGTIKRSLGRAYDALGRIQSVRNAAGSDVALWSYDNGDNVDLVTDGLGRVTNQDVDPLGRLSQAIANQGGINATTQLAYDANDHVTSIIDPKGLTTSYTYNGLGDLLQLTSPDTGTAINTYDAAGNLQSQQDARGRVTGYLYDALGRLTAQTVPTATQNVYFDFDVPQPDCTGAEQFGAGRLSRIRDESGNTRYCYDRLGSLVRKVQTVTDGPTLTLGSTRNSAGRLVAMTYPSGAIVTYVRDADGRVTNVQAKPTATAAQVTIVSAATYLPFGPLSSLTFGNGRLLAKTYDADYNIDGVADSAADGLNHDLTTDVVSNVIGLSERTSAATTIDRTIGYDALDRLTSFKEGATNIQSFTYDATGNRLKTITGTTTKNNTYPATSHWLTKFGSQTRTYDAIGNTLTIAAKALVYDDRNRLRDYLNNGSTLTRTYRYNGLGERVSKTIAAANTANRYYMYDDAGRLLGEYKADGTRVQEYVWLDDTLVGVLANHDGAKYQFVETDHLGTPRAIIHPTKNTIIWRWNSTDTAFGEHLALNDPDANGINYTFNLRYPGQYFDSESGLHYNYFRDYDPKTGRYIESDPIGQFGGPSTYGYVSSSPFTHLDPSGLVQWRGKIHYGSASIGVPKVKWLTGGTWVRVMLDLESTCTNGKAIKVSIASSQLFGPDVSVGPDTNVLGDVFLDDGLKELAVENLVGKFGVTGKMTGVGRASGTVVAGDGHGTFTATGIVTGGFNYSGEGESLAWSGFRPKNCDCEGQFLPKKW